MKRLFYLLTCVAATAGFLLGVGCERHPASQTIPDHAEKEAQKKAGEHEKMEAVGTGSNTPTYFPAKEN